MIEHFEQTEASLARLRGPIGIYIGSKTPPEIAVSVMAEILAVKNAVRLPREMDVAAARTANFRRPTDALRRAGRGSASGRFLDASRIQDHPPRSWCRCACVWPARRPSPRAVASQP